VSIAVTCRVSYAETAPIYLLSSQLLSKAATEASLRHRQTVAAAGTDNDNVKIQHGCDDRSMASEGLGVLLTRPRSTVAVSAVRPSVRRFRVRSILRRQTRQSSGMTRRTEGLF